MRRFCFITDPQSGSYDTATVDLLWHLITGAWVAAHPVTDTNADGLTVTERRPPLALFDGEPVMIDPATRIAGGSGAEYFITARNAV